MEILNYGSASLPFKDSKISVKDKYLIYKKITTDLSIYFFTGLKNVHVGSESVIQGYGSTNLDT